MIDKLSRLILVDPEKYCPNTVVQNLQIINKFGKLLMARQFNDKPCM
jgi:hypothetical protein